MRDGEKGEMNMIKRIENTRNVSALFDGWDETIIWSCLQGVMGAVYADDQENPSCAMAILGDFAFFAGEAGVRETPARASGGCPGQRCKAGSAGKELLTYKPEWCEQDFIIMVPQNESWAELIEQCYEKKAKKVTRYAFKKEPDAFDREKLRAAAEALPEGYSMKLMDEALFHQCKETGWCKDWVAQYDDYDAYCRHGLGVVILKDGVPVSGASSYSGYRGGIEIEIDTKEEYRRKGLAHICGAELILECLARGLYPSWDAQNPKSAALAEKLGYHFDHAYTAYEIWGY